VSDTAQENRLWALKALQRAARRAGKAFVVFLAGVLAFVLVACGDNVKLLPDAPVGTPSCQSVGCFVDGGPYPSVFCRRDGLCECPQTDGKTVLCTEPTSN
jgi:hypothetical protein